MNKRQTAVDFLLEGMRNMGIQIPKDKAQDLLNLIHECKAVEKHNIIQARCTSPVIGSPNMDDYLQEATQYYNNTYGI